MTVLLKNHFTVHVTDIIYKKVCSKACDDEVKHTWSKREEWYELVYTKNIMPKNRVNIHFCSAPLYAL